MKIATFNINNINKRLANLLNWLEKEKPEIVCLQELKTEQYSFPADALRSAGYELIWAGQETGIGDLNQPTRSRSDASLLAKLQRRDKVVNRTCLQCADTIDDPL